MRSHSHVKGICRQGSQIVPRRTPLIKYCEVSGTRKMTGPDVQGPHHALPRTFFSVRCPQTKWRFLGGLTKWPVESLPACRALWMRCNDYLFSVGGWSGAAINQAVMLGLSILFPQTGMECGWMMYSTCAISLCPSYLIWNQSLRRVMSLFRPNLQNAIQGKRCVFARTQGESKGNLLTFVWTS